MKILKRLKNNGGFSLVECIISIGLLAVMSLMVCSLLTATARMRRENSDREREIGDQIDTLVAGTPAQTQALAGDAIKFFVGDTKIDSIGNTPSDANKKISASKEFDPTANMQVGALNFDFSQYQAQVEESSGGPSGPGGVSAIPKVYGGAKTSSNVKVTQATTPALGSDDYYTVSWNIDYHLEDGRSPDEAMKFVCPIGAVLDANPVSWTGSSTDASVLVISDRAVRVYADVGWANFTVTFKLYKDDFNNNYKSFADYFSLGTGATSTSFSKQSDGLFK